MKIFTGVVIFHLVEIVCGENTKFIGDQQDIRTTDCDSVSNGEYITLQ